MITDSKKLDKAIRYSKISRILGAASWILYFTAAFSGYINLTFFAIALVCFILSITAYKITEIKSRISDREIIAFSFMRISEGIDKGSVKKDYLKFMSKNWYYDNEDAINKEDGVFRDYIIKISRFDKDIVDIVLKLNHANNNDLLNKFDSKLLMELAIMIYNNSGEPFALANKISLSYKEKENFLNIFDYVRSISQTKFGLFVFYESVLIIFLALFYNFFLENKEVVSVGFFTITTAIMVIISKKDKR